MKSQTPNKQKFIFTLANQITLFRIVLTPIIVILMLQNLTLWATGLYIFSIFTDLLDGIVARLKKEQTQIGAFLDPMADKLLLTAAYLTLTYMNQIDMWVFVVIFSRDLLIVLGWTVLYILTGSSKVAPRPLGKLTTAVQMIGALVFILPLPDPAGKIILWAIVLFTIASVGDYIIVGEKRLGEWA